MPDEASITPVDGTSSGARNRAARQAVPRFPGIEFVPRNLARPVSADVVQPQSGELLLWRFRPEWQAISRGDGYTRLSNAELARVRNHPNPALGKRFAVSRVVLREILSGITDCPPDDVELADDAQGRPRLLRAGQPSPLSIAVAYAGIWILVGVSTSAIGLATHVPTLSDSRGAALSARTRTVAQPTTKNLADVQSRVRHASLVDAAGKVMLDADDQLLCRSDKDFVVDTPEGRHWHILDLPMPGAICAAAALAQPISRIHAFGWIGRDGWLLAR